MKPCPKCNEPVKGKAQFCPSCGEKIGRRSAGEKKARLTEEKRSSKPLILTIAALVAAALLAGGGFALFRAPSTTVSASPGEAQAMTFPLSTFDDGKAKYYSYKAPSGKDIKFFVLRSSDGVVRAAFDACDVCYASKKGYRQEGDFMVCNNCGQRFASTRINEVKGGCNPAPLSRRIDGSNLVIAVADVVTGGWYF